MARAPTRAAVAPTTAVAAAEIFHSRAYFFHNAHKLVAQHHGVLHDVVADGAVDPVVHVGAADAGVVHGDEDVVGVRELGHGPLCEGYVIGFVEDEREVLSVVFGEL